MQKTPWRTRDGWKVLALLFILAFGLTGLSSYTVWGEEAERQIDSLDDVYITGFFQNAPEQQLHWTHVPLQNATDPYFFLPAGADSDTVRIWFAKRTTNQTTGAFEYIPMTGYVTIDGKQVESGDLIALPKENGTLSIVTGSGKTFRIGVKKSARVPSLFIETESGSLNNIHANKDNKEKGDMLLMQQDGTVDYQGTLKHIKGRGNATWDRPKKPYNIKLDESANLLGMGKAKGWCLLANYLDTSLLRNQIVYNLAEETGILYTMDSRSIDLYLNGKYRGTYLMTEKVEIDKNRVNLTDMEKATEKVNDADLDSYPAGGTAGYWPGTRKWVNIPQDPADITGGYLIELELDERYAAEACGFVTKIGQAVTMKAPEFVSKNQIQYIADFYQEMENAIYSKTGYNDQGRHFSEYIDEESIAKMYLLQEYSLNLDTGITSFYLYKDSDITGDGKLHMAPVWDFDMAIGNHGVRDGVDLSRPDVWWANQAKIYNHREYKNLLAEAVGHDSVKRLIVEHWNEVFDPAVRALLEQDTDYRPKKLRGITEYREELAASAELNFVAWPDSLQHTITGIWNGENFTKSLDYVENFLKQREAFLNRAFAYGQTSGYTRLSGTVTIAGKMTVGETVTAQVADSNAKSFSYQWMADGEKLADAVDAAYVLTEAEIGKKISVEVRAKDERILASLTGVASQKVQASGLDPIVLEVEGELGPNGDGAYAVSSGKEQDIHGKEVEYMQVSSDMYANGRWIVEFPYAGAYQMQMVMAVPTWTDQVRLEWAPAGSNSFTVVNEDIPIEQTAANEYRVFDGPVLVVEEAGEYDLKFGSWAANANWKLDKFIFTCNHPVAPPSTDEPLVVEKGETLTLKESLAVHKNGSLRNRPVNGSYVDYAIDVKESGDYVLTYSIGANEAAVEDAFQVLVAPYRKGASDYDFAQKLAPVQMTRYYDPIQEKQSIHLEAGTYILRTKACNEGFSLSQLHITERIVTEAPADGTPVRIWAVDFNHGDKYHAIQNVTAEDKGNIGYAAQGLGLDYALQVKKGGIYSIVYHYTAARDGSMTTQCVADGAAMDLAVSQLVGATGGGSWYESDYIDSAAVPILLKEGMNTLRVHWDFADVNLKAFTLCYQGSALDYVTDLLKALPEKDALTLDDEEAVEKAKVSYDALTKIEQSQIPEGLVVKLREALAQIPVLQLAKAVAEDQTDLEQSFAAYRQEDYHPDKWIRLVAAKDNGLQAIARAETIAESHRALRDAKAAMAAVERKLQAIRITSDRTIILAQSKAYRRNGFLNSQVKVGNYADYFIDVPEAGEYTFTYALYADEAVSSAFAVKYDASEYPEQVEQEYARVDVPKVEMEGNLVKEIRGTIVLKEGEQTIRFEALSEKVRLNRIKICKKTTAEIAVSEEGEAAVMAADSFSQSFGPCILKNGAVTETAAGTTLEYPVFVKEETAGEVAYVYAYAKEGAPNLILSKVEADGSESILSQTAAGRTQNGYQESERTSVILPAGAYTLRITMENDGVDLKSFAIGRGGLYIPVNGIRLNAYRVHLKPQGTFRLSAVLTPEHTTSQVTWSVRDAAVAQIDENGVVTALQEGSTVITAVADKQTAECAIVVSNGPGDATERPPVSTDPDQTELVPTFIGGVDAAVLTSVLYTGGNTKKSTAIELTIPTGAQLASVTYDSQNPSVATVSAAGIVTAKKAGTASIRIGITLANGETVFLSRQITVKKAYIKLKKTHYSVKKGKTLTLKATAYGSNKKITFVFANQKSKKCAKLTKSGKLTGTAKGSVKITAKSGKVKKTFTVKVK